MSAEGGSNVESSENDEIVPETDIVIKPESLEEPVNELEEEVEPKDDSHVVDVEDSFEKEEDDLQQQAANSSDSVSSTKAT